LLASEQRLDQPDTVPVPVREVVLRRIARLPEAAAAVLSVAAVAGRCFDALVVAEAASVEVDAALEAIDAAVAVGLAVEYEQRLGWFRSRTRSSPTPPSPCLAPSCSPRWVFQPDRGDFTSAVQLTMRIDVALLFRTIGLTTLLPHRVAKPAALPSTAKPAPARTAASS
jgi:hypothetical protein